MRRRTYWPPGYRPLLGKIPRRAPRHVGKARAPSDVVLSMTATARSRLEDLRTQTLELLSALQGEHRAVVDASRDSNADDEHDPEGATIAFERAQVEALVRDAE